MSALLVKAIIGSTAAALAVQCVGHNVGWCKVMLAHTVGLPL